MGKETIHIQAQIHAPVETVWNAYNDPKAIQKWNQASSDWHCPAAENDLREGGKFKNTMAAKDGSFSFDFEGTYTHVAPLKSLSYIMDDGRTVDISFDQSQEKTSVHINFQAEETNPIDMQREGWQAILNSFKNYVEQ